MQSQFSTYFTLGLDHITDPKGYDHIIFIIALCAIYRLSEWRKVAVLVSVYDGSQHHFGTRRIADSDPSV